MRHVLFGMMGLIGAAFGGVFISAHAPAASILLLILMAYGLVQQHTSRIQEQNLYNIYVALFVGYLIGGLLTLVLSFMTASPM